MDLRKKEDKNRILSVMIQRFDQIGWKNNNHITLIDIWNVEDYIQKRFKLSNLQTSLMTDYVFKLKLLSRTMGKLENEYHQETINQLKGE